MDAQGELLGEVPAYNTIAELRGASLPDEYVVDSNPDAELSERAACARPEASGRVSAEALPPSTY